MSGICDIFGSYAGSCRSVKNFIFQSGKSEGNESIFNCGVSKQGTSSVDGTPVPPTHVGDARVGGEGGITINDAGVAIIPAPYLVNIARDRAQGTDIKIAPIRFTAPNAGSKPIAIIVETVPGTLDPSLAGQNIDGLIDVEPVAPKEGKTIQVNGPNGPYNIINPTLQSRPPVYMGAYTLEDKTGKISNIAQETCSASALLDPQGVAHCESYRIQANGSQNQYEFVVPKEAYSKDNSLDINYGFTLRVDTSNMIPGHKYMLYLRVRLVIGGQAATADGGTTGAPDAGIPVPDQGTSE